MFANPNCPFSAGITVRFEPARLSVFRKNPCPFSTGINVRFAQELLSAFSKNRCPFCAGFCKKAVKTIATALGELNARAVFVGGAVVSLYIDDPSADDVRPTKDVDISLNIATFSDLEKIRLLLTEKGFFQTSEDNVICRFRFQDIKVDVMSTQAVGWAPANRWFEPGFRHLHTMQLDEVEVKIMGLPWFLAAKFDAFYDRGFKDPRTSHDFEDIVYLLNYTTNLDKLILKADTDVQLYLKEAFKSILENHALQEAVIGNLYYEDQIKRFDKIIQTLNNIIHAIYRTKCS